jgi:hypothetical protein
MHYQDRDQPAEGKRRALSTTISTCVPESLKQTRLSLNNFDGQGR